MVIYAPAFNVSGVQSVDLAKGITRQFVDGPAIGVLVTQVIGGADEQFDIVRRAAAIGFAVSATTEPRGARPDSRSLLAGWMLLAAPRIARLLVAANDPEIDVMRDWARFVGKPLAVIGPTEGSLVLSARGANGEVNDNALATQTQLRVCK